MINWKRAGRLFDWVMSIMAIALICFIIFSCQKNKLPRAHVGAMEANQCWMMVNPPMEIGQTYPYMDKQDPNIMYLVEVLGRGESIRVDLKARTTSLYKFNVSNWDDVGKSEIKLDNGKQMYNPESPIWTEFRGQTQTRNVSHTYGYPWPNEPGTRDAVLRSGYWYVIDKRGDRNVELLRVKIENAELESGDLGEIDVSQNKKWIVFTLTNIKRSVYIFNRESLVLEKFHD